MSRDISFSFQIFGDLILALVRAKVEKPFFTVKSIVEFICSLQKVTSVISLLVAELNGTVSNSVRVPLCK